MRQVISPKALEQHIQVCHRTLRKAFRGLYQGSLTEKEAMDLCLRTLHDGLKPWLRAQGLRLCLDTQAQFRQFAHDHAQWQAGMRLSAPQTDVWLAAPNPSTNAPGSPCTAEAASPLDMAHVFQLLQALSLPVAFFQPLPDDAVRPDLLPGHFQTDLVLGLHIWNENGAALEQALRCSACVVLSDHHGLQTPFQPAAYLPVGNTADGSTVFDTYIGSGSIEGYTTSRPRTIRLSLLDGIIHHLFTTQDAADYDVFQRFPLWEAYREHQQQQKALLQDVYAVLAAQFACEGRTPR